MTGTLITIFSFLPIAILICIPIILVFNKTKVLKVKTSLRFYAIGYGICIAVFISALLTVYFDPAVVAFVYLTLFIPLILFSFMLTKKLITDTKLRNRFINFTYKFLATILIWAIALSPLSLAGIMAIIEMPEKKARNQEMLRLQEEIFNLETYADLTPFGLGVYKLQNEGDMYLWDATKPEDSARTYEGVDIVYDYLVNRRDREVWDYDLFKMDDIYDVISYEDIYIIITPLLERYDENWQRSSIYLCKDFNKNADLFQLSFSDPKVAEKLLELSTEKISRAELMVKFGKIAEGNTLRTK